MPNTWKLYIKSALQASCAPTSTNNVTMSYTVSGDGCATIKYASCSGIVQYGTECSDAPLQTFIDEMISYFKSNSAYNPLMTDADTIYVNDALYYSPGATHYLDIYVKHYSWYTTDSAGNWLVSKLTDITGNIANVFKDITDYQYLGTEIISEADKPGIVTIRIQLRQLSAVALAGPLLAAVIDLIFWILVVVIVIGVITGWKFTLAGLIAQITGKEYSGKDVVGIVWTNPNSVVNHQLAECEKNFTDPVQQANCKKSVLCGAADGLTDSLKLSGTDCKTLQINEKIDACTAQYNIDHDATKYKACVKGVADNTGPVILNKAPDGGSITGFLLLAGLGLGVLYFTTRPAEKTVYVEPPSREQGKQEK